MIKTVEKLLGHVLKSCESYLHAVDMLKSCRNVLTLLTDTWTLRNMFKNHGHR